MTLATCGRGDGRTPSTSSTAISPTMLAPGLGAVKPQTPPELAEEHMHELHEFYDYDGDLGLDDFR
jgi:hypothetical protein